MKRLIQAFVAGLLFAGLYGFTVMSSGGTLGVTRVNVISYCASGCTATAGPYVPTAGMIYDIIECVGGGGGAGGVGASSSGNISSSGGGGGGGYSRALATPAGSQTVTIGTGGPGGAPGSNGTNGGDSSLGAFCIGKGGIASTNAASNLASFGGAGGPAGTGNLLSVPGQDGGSGYVSNSVAISARTHTGGNAGLGFGAGGGTATQGPTAGQDGSNYGGGGGGARSSNGAGNATGGSGAGGIIIITEYIR